MYAIRNARWDQKLITERAFEVAGVVETAVRLWADSAPLPFDGSADEVQVTGLAHTNGFDPSQNRACQIEIVLSCRARI